jgi:hypothetical protein
LNLNSKTLPNFPNLADQIAAEKVKATSKYLKIFEVKFQGTEGRQDNNSQNQNERKLNVEADKVCYICIRFAKAKMRV